MITIILHLTLSIYLVLYAVPCKNVNFRFWKVLFWGLCWVIYTCIMGMSEGFQLGLETGVTGL